MEFPASSEIKPILQRSPIIRTATPNPQATVQIVVNENKGNNEAEKTIAEKDYLINEKNNVINQMLSVFNTAIVVISALIVLLSLFIVIFNYYFLIKPTEKLDTKIKEFDENIKEIGSQVERDLNKKFLEYMKNKQNSDIEQALENITSNNQSTRSMASVYFMVNQDIKLNDLQVLNVYNFLKDFSGSAMDRIQVKNSLEMLLSKQDSKYCEIYFRKVLNSEPLDTSSLFNALKYFEYSDYTNYLKDIKLSVLNSNNQFEKLKTLISSLPMISEKFTLDLISDEQFTNEFNENQLKEISNLLEHNPILTDEFKQKFKELNLLKDKGKS